MSKLSLDIEMDQFDEPQLVLYIRWDANADSWTGSPKILSIHTTLDGALEAMPENIKTDTYKRTAESWSGKDIVVNYTYEFIEKRLIGA